MSAEAKEPKMKSKKDPKTPTVVSIDSSKLSHTPKVEICPRDEKGRFLKGFSGNPHAWATRKMNTQLALLCRENVETNLSTLQSIIQNNDVDPAVRVAAIKLSFEYGYGKPMQSLDMHNAEHRDYQGLIRYLSREAHEHFNFRGDLNVVESEKEIKDFLASKIQNDSCLDKIFDDVIKRVGSFGFQRYIDDLNENGVYYKYQED